MNPIVVVGAGLAGATAVTAWREGVTTVRSSRSAPRAIRPMSARRCPRVTCSATTRSRVPVHEPQWYAAHDIDLRTGAFVTDLDLGRKSVSLLDGTRDRLRQAAVGDREPATVLPLADDSGVPTAYLRTVEDSDRIRAAFGPGNRIVIIGAGWIGLEVAVRCARRGDRGDGL